LDLDFTPEDARFREEVCDWLHDNVPKEKQPHEGVAAREFDMAWQRKQYEGGWAGIAWPTEYGGRGLSTVEQLIWYEESAKVRAPGANTCFVGLAHGGPTLIVNGTEGQKTFHLPKILRGEVIWCQGFSEPGAGSDLAGISTRAVIDGDELVVSGSKIWTSYAHLADYQELLLRTDPDSRRHGGLSWVICDMSLPGITIRPILFATGEHHFNQVFYDDVRIPIANVVGGVNNGWKTAMSTLSFERGTAFAATQISLSQSVDDLIERAKTRTGPDGRPAFASEDIGRRLSKLRAEAMALRALTYVSVARNVRRDQPGPDGSVLKILGARASQEVAAIWLELEGADGILDTDASHHYIRSFASTVGGGTDEVQHNIVAERMLGLPKAV
jgi:alkylation response protein AidB-like acyl-CoA dehydrogenase